MHKYVLLILILQMQLTLAEDLLKNADDWAVVIGDLFNAVSNNASNNSLTITPPQENIGMTYT